MAVGFSNTNKPINPRGQDASPLAYNRSKLFSGKALDFDGVNDYVTFDGFAGTLSNNDAWTACGYIKTNADIRGTWFSAHTSTGGNVIRVGTESGADGLFYADVITGDVQIGDFDFKDNKWHFVALSRVQGANGAIVTLFVDGVQSGTQATGINWDSATQFSLGQEYDGTGKTDFWNGLLANFKIFNTALTAAQVADLYNNPEKVVPTGVDNTALKLWLPMMEGAGTKCLDGASLHTATERVENGDFSNGTTGWVGNPQTTLSVTNGQLDIQSASGSGEYGAAFSEVNFTSGKYYLFQLDIVSCNNPAQIRIGASNSATLYSQDIWASGEIGVGTHSILWLAPSDYTYLSIGGRNDVTTLVIDNVSVKEVSVGNISGATWTHGIGSPVAQTSVIDWNKRILDKTNEFLIPQGLTAGRDLLGNLFENVRKQGALNLDGNSWAEVHDNASLDVVLPCTLEAWVNNKTGELSVNNRYMAIFDKAPSSNGGGGFSLRLYSNISANGGYIALDGSFSTFNFTDGSYQHIVVTLEANSQKIYINGALQNSYTNAWTLAQNGETLKIGYAPSDGEQWLNGSIAQPRIYNRALTAAEVLRNYNSGKNTYK